MDRRMNCKKLTLFLSHRIKCFIRAKSEHENREERREKREERRVFNSQFFIPSLYFCCTNFCFIERRNFTSNKKGLTILEVVMAIAIFTIMSTIIMKFLGSADRLYGKSLAMKNATTLAQNEAELLKAQGPLLETLEDNEYEKSIGKRSFIITRKVFEPDSLDSLIKDYSLSEIELKVSDALRPEKPLVTFMLLQGYNGEAK